MIHDPMDNITTKATEHGSYQYDYDDLHRLTSVDNPVVPSLDDEAFTYDSVGNRLTSADTTSTWSYNQNNELQSYDNVSYVYDDNGNMTQKTDNGVVSNYIYNPDNRLSSVEDGNNSTVIAEYYYDPFGRRLWKEVSGTRTYFHYTSEGLIGEYDSNGNEVKTYGYKPSSEWTTSPLFMKESGLHYFYHTDKLGTHLKMTGVNGALVWSAQYTSFGEGAVDTSSTVINNLRFPGQYFDSETWLHYNYHRYYVPMSGRYLTPDPIGLEGGVNLFVYVLNDPVNAIDSSGLYGTNDCSYYKKRCKQIGGKYYCDTAPKWCNRFPKYPDPNPSKDDDYEGWARCTRKCLQDCDKENADKLCKEDVDDFWDKVHFYCHCKCYSECSKGKFTGKNPY